jgi:hypothetical protein
MMKPTNCPIPTRNATALVVHTDRRSINRTSSSGSAWRSAAHAQVASSAPAVASPSQVAVEP